MQTSRPTPTVTLRPMAAAPLLADQVDGFLADLRAEGFRPRAVERYGDHLTALRRYLGPDATIADLTPAAVASFQRELSEAGRSSSTIAGALTTIRKLAKYLQVVGIPIADPTSGRRWPKKRATAPRALIRPDVRRFWAAIQTAPSDLRPAAAYKWRRTRRGALLMLCAGLRIAEVWALTWDDVDMEQRALMVRTGKGGKDRPLPMNEHLWNALNEVAPERRRGAVVDCARGEAFATPNALGNAYRKFFAQVGFPNMTPHVLRHTFATELLRSKVDLETIRQLMGHESLETTQRYLLADPERLRGAVDLLGGW